MENHFIQHLPVRIHCRKVVYNTQGVQKNALTRDQNHPKFSMLKITPTSVYEV